MEAKQLHDIVVKMTQRANKNSTRFEMGVVVAESGTGKVQTTTSGREFNRDSVSMASVERINAGESIIMLGSGVHDVNFGLIRSPWISG